LGLISNIYTYTEANWFFSIFYRRSQQLQQSYHAQTQRSVENAKAEIRDEQRSLADIKRGQEEQTQLLKEIKRSVDFMVAQEKYTQALIELAALKKNTQEIEAENKRLLEQIETFSPNASRDRRRMLFLLILLRQSRSVPKKKIPR
jgi:hypothetical protein